MKKLMLAVLAAFVPGLVPAVHAANGPETRGAQLPGTRQNSTLAAKSKKKHKKAHHKKHKKGKARRKTQV